MDFSYRVKQEYKKINFSFIFFIWKIFFSLRKVSKGETSMLCSAQLKMYLPHKQGSWLADEEARVPAAQPADQANLNSNRNSSERSWKFNGTEPGVGGGAKFRGDKLGTWPARPAPRAPGLFLEDRNNFNFT